MSALPLWTYAEAAAATGGRCTAEWLATGIGIDSRTTAPGDLFVALRGPNFDGHSFVADALRAGAVAAMVDHLPEAAAAEAPLLVVDDTLEALRALAAAARQRTTARIVGVTGSVGKTGVKEALRLTLSRQGATTANQGSLNNHWGLPLSLARLRKHDAFGVFEMGMNHPGEIVPLTRLARPDVAVITTVEAVHMESFASVEEIADAKAEIFAGCGPDATAVLFRDNPHFARLAAAARHLGIRHVLAFGGDAFADVRLLSSRLDAEGSTVRAMVEGRVVEYRVGLPGSHWVTNSLCVLAAVAAAGADVDGAAAALADLQPAKGRGQRFTLALGGGSFELVDDSYNASPVSMAASFAVLGRLAPGAGGRRIAVIGDMLELGADELALHAGLATGLCDHNVDLVFAAGPRMRALFEALPAAMQGAHAADSTLLAPIVAHAVRPGDVVAVKGSAGSRMGRVVDALKALPAAAAEPARRTQGS
ncbi:MAG: UDP-N-acetylmuramoylalanyl-D-glutamyl-2,6-diaminopimelate--D-alanyl-D-alanine ligase [Rhodospirillales bacterium]